jgi:hypothetical protein
MWESQLGPPWAPQDTSSAPPLAHYFEHSHRKQSRRATSALLDSVRAVNAKGSTAELSQQA